MTISTSDNTPRVSYSVSEGATQTSFTVSFQFFSESDLNVYVDGTKKTITTHYTVSGGSGSTGTVSISVTGASGGSTVIITREIALDRTTDFPTSGAFTVSTLNTELDRFVAIQADLDDNVTRSIHLADADTAVSMELPLKASRLGTVLGFNASTGAVEAGPTIANVNALSAITANINTVAGISSNVTTVAGISSNVTTVAGIAANVTSVAGVASLITSDFVSDLNTLATTAIVEDLNILATSDIVSDLNTLATSDIVTDINVLATSDIVSDINTLATSDIVSDLNTLATSDIVSDLNTLATTAIVEDLNLLATSSVIADMASLAGSGANPNITTVTASGAITAGSFVIGSADINENDLEAIDGVTAGTVAASKAVVVDTNKDISSFRNITLTGELDAGSLDVSGNVDVGGLLKMPDVTSGKILVGDGTSYQEVAVSGDVTMASSGAVTIATDAVESGMLNDNVISGQTELGSGIADTDEILISDGGLVKRTDMSVVKTYIGGGGRNRFIYTVSSGATSVTGNDDSSSSLSFSSGANVDVYLNGVLLVPTTDYNTSTANTIAGLTSMAANDVLTVLVFE